MSFTQRYTAQRADIDELGHVNNAVWVRWIQDIATAHWSAVARKEDNAAYFWVVTRHEIDYRGNIEEGETVTGQTWIEGPARGATSMRRVDFRDADDKVIVSAATTWAMLNRKTSRPVRVTPDLLAPFASRD